MIKGFNDVFAKGATLFFKKYPKIDKLIFGFREQFS